MGLTFEVKDQTNISKTTYNSYRFIGFGIQLELSVSIVTGGGELVFYTDSEILNGRPWYQPDFYLYGGAGLSADIKHLISQLTDNPALLLGNGSGTLVGGSACVFAIFGNNDFHSPADYRGPFDSVSVTVAGKKVYASWSNTSVVGGVGLSTEPFQVSTGRTWYDLVGDGEFLDGYDLALQARQIAETLEAPM